MSNEPTTTPSSQGSAWTEDRVADLLYKRELDLTDGGKIADEYPELDLDSAYRVQRKLVDLKVAGGEGVIGVKDQDDRLADEVEIFAGHPDDILSGAGGDGWRIRRPVIHLAANTMPGKNLSVLL
ncbi:hypothetical protein [Arthrobacter sp. efr-133-TYG-118]|uniref:hypothetical protein n=1 Tax=Arthrobacter sp. efr-133-TYG-118 TaxID=3040279 RepID=UPI00254F18AF|nr:hypothetical protein [Arthrobacter sp. efr-133-TYG-118]